MACVYIVTSSLGLGCHLSSNLTRPLYRCPSSVLYSIDGHDHDEEDEDGNHPAHDEEDEGGKKV